MALDVVYDLTWQMTIRLLLNLRSLLSRLRDVELEGILRLSLGTGVSLLTKVRLSTLFVRDRIRRICVTLMLLKVALFARFPVRRWACLYLRLLPIWWIRVNVARTIVGCISHRCSRATLVYHLILQSFLVFIVLVKLLFSSINIVKVLLPVLSDNFRSLL